MAKLKNGSWLLCLTVFLQLQLHLAQGFFIDLETLGFSSKSEDTDAGDESSKVLIAAPSEQQYVEVESESDPNKSVKLTVQELKALILGSVKEITANPPPINIKISADGGIKNADKPKPTVSDHKGLDHLDVPNKPVQPPSYAESGGGYGMGMNSYNVDENDFWGFAENIESDDEKATVKPENSLLLTAAKSVFRGPAHIMNSYHKTFSRWRGKPNANKKIRSKHRRPLPSFVYSREEMRNRRPNKRPKQRRPYRNGSSKSKPNSHYYNNYNRKTVPDYDDYVDGSYTDEFEPAGQHYSQSSISRTPWRFRNRIDSTRRESPPVSISTQLSPPANSGGFI